MLKKCNNPEAFTVGLKQNYLWRVEPLFRLELLNNSYPALHGLRVIAVVFIVQVHLTAVSGFRRMEIPEGFAWASQAFWPGMDFFFVLSGFLIGTMLLRSLKGGKGLKLGRFYARRAFRIFPLYYVSLVLISILPQYPQVKYVSGLQPHHDGIGWREWIYLTNYPMDFHNVMYWSWSLSVEEHFYLLVPFMLLGLQALPGHKVRLGLLTALWASCALVKAFVLYLNWDRLPQSFFNSIYFPTHARYDALIAGVFAAYIHATWAPQLEKFFRTWTGKALAWGSTVGVFVLAQNFFSVSEMATGSKDYYVRAAYIVGTPTSLAFTCLILWAVADGKRLLGHRIFLYLATLSYGVYLIHIPVLEQIVLPHIFEPALKSGMNFGLAWSGTLTLGLVLIFFFSYLLHLVVEKPMLRLRERWAPRETSVGRSISVDPKSE